MTSPMISGGSSGSACAEPEFSIAATLKKPAPAVATIPRPIRRSVRPGILRPFGGCELLVVRALSGPSGAGIQHMFYSAFGPLSEKYTGFRWSKLSFSSKVLDGSPVPQKFLQSIVAVISHTPTFQEAPMPRLWYGGCERGWGPGAGSA